MSPKSAPARVPEFERNIAQMDSDEALRFLDTVRAQVAKGKLSPKKLANLLSEYSSEPRVPAEPRVPVALNIPDDLMRTLAAKMNPADLANLMLTSKDIKRQTEPVSRANAAASPLLYLPPKLLGKVLSNVKMGELSALKRTSRFASEQVDKAVLKINPCLQSDLARAILTLANWVHKKKPGQVRINLGGWGRSIRFPVVMNDGTTFPIANGDYIQMEAHPAGTYSYINLPAKLDENTIRRFALYLQASWSEQGERGHTTFEFAVGDNRTRAYSWMFGYPLDIPQPISDNRDYLKVITAYAKTINKCFYPNARSIARPTSPLAS